MMSQTDGHRLYIADMARRQSAMEDGRAPMEPLCYRVLAKRLRSALAGEGPTRVCKDFIGMLPGLLPLFIEALEVRHFDEHGLLYGPDADGVRAVAQALMDRLCRPGTPSGMKLP